MKKIILPVVLILAVLLFFSPRFLINVKITCKSQYGDCPSEIVEQIKSLNGKKMFYVKNQLGKILESNFLVSAFNVQFKLPNVLKVDLIIKKPAFALKNISSAEILLIDKEGRILSKSTQTSLPIVFTNDNFSNIGDKVSDKNLFALELILGLSKMYQVTSGTIEGDTLLVDIPGGVRVLFPLEGAEKDLLLGSLRLIYTNIRDVSGKMLYSQIDLRYHDPVLR